MVDEDGRVEPELERLAALLREAAGAGAAATVARAMAAGEAFPTGARARRLLMRAQAAAGAELAPSFVTLVIRAIGEVIEVVTDGAVGYTVLAPAQLRGEGIGGVLIRQRLGDREIAAHVDARPEDRFVVMLDFGIDSGVRGTRVSLLRDEREVLSESLRQGRVLLPELTPGTWRVKVRDSDGWVGVLDLVLKARAA